MLSSSLLEDLPNEIILEIVEYLPTEQRFLLSECSRRLCNIALHDLDSLMGKGILLRSMLLYSIKSRPNDTTLSDFIMEKHLKHYKQKNWRSVSVFLTGELYTEAILYDSYPHIRWIEEKSGNLFFDYFTYYFQSKIKRSIFVGKEKLVDQIIADIHKNIKVNVNQSIPSIMASSGSELYWNLIQDDDIYRFQNSLDCVIIPAIRSRKVEIFKRSIRRIEKLGLTEKIPYRPMRYLSLALKTGKGIIYDEVHKFVEFISPKSGDISRRKEELPRSCLIKAVERGNISSVEKIIEYCGMEDFANLIPCCGDLNLVKKFVKKGVWTNDLLLNALYSNNIKVIRWILVNCFSKTRNGILLDTKLSIIDILGTRVNKIEIFNLMIIVDETFSSKIYSYIPTIQYKALKEGNVEYALELGKKMKISPRDTLMLWMDKNQKNFHHFMIDFIFHKKDGISIMEKFFGKKLLSAIAPHFPNFYYSCIQLLTRKDEEALRRGIWFGRKYKFPPIRFAHLEMLAGEYTYWVDPHMQNILDKVYEGFIPSIGNFMDYLSIPIHMSGLRKYGYKPIEDHSTGNYKLVKKNFVDKTLDVLYNIFVEPFVLK